MQFSSCVLKSLLDLPAIIMTVGHVYSINHEGLDVYVHEATTNPQKQIHLASLWIFASLEYIHLPSPHR